MARPTLLMLPGLLATRRVFQPQIDALSDTVDIVIPELWHYDSMAAMADAAATSAMPAAVCSSAASSPPAAANGRPGCRQR